MAFSVEESISGSWKSRSIHTTQVDADAKKQSLIDNGLDPALVRVVEVDLTGLPTYIIQNLHLLGIG